MLPYAKIAACAALAVVACGLLLPAMQPAADDGPLTVPLTLVADEQPIEARVLPSIANAEIEAIRFQLAELRCQLTESNEKLEQYRAYARRMEHYLRGRGIAIEGDRASARRNGFLGNDGYYGEGRPRSVSHTNVISGAPPLDCKSGKCQNFGSVRVYRGR